MSINDTQLGPKEAQQIDNAPDGVDAHFVESSLGIPFPEFDTSEFLTTVDSNGEVQILGFYEGSSVPDCAGPPSEFTGGPGRPLVIVQSKKRASFF